MTDQRTATIEPSHKIRFGVSLDPETHRIAQELAREKHGDNVSRLFRHLLRDEWDRARAESEREELAVQVA